VIFLANRYAKRKAIIEQNAQKKVAKKKEVKKEEPKKTTSKLAE